MTAIAGLVSGGKVWIGGDSAATNSWLMQTIRDDPKVFRVGEFLFGTAGSIRMKNVLRYSFSPPTPTEGNTEVAYFVRQFIPALRTEYRNAGIIEADKGVDSICGEMLIGWRSGLYFMQSDLQIAKASKASCFHAIGCGGDLSLGSLFTTEGTKLKPEERITKALQAAERFSAGVRGPFTIESV